MTLPPFQSEPVADFSIDGPREAFRAGLARVGGELGRTYPLVVGGREIATGETLRSVNPAHPEVVVGAHAVATAEHVDQAVAAATAAFPAWSRVSLEDRVAVLLRASRLVQERRSELGALMVYELGKAWDEADGEVAEVIDLLQWYARQALRLEAGGEVTSLPGEIDRFRYLPLGPGAVISPWNFPLSLTVGMFSAAVVTGNTVVIKPAETSSTSVAWLVDIFRECRLPDGVVNLLTGYGEVAGAALVEHPGIRFVSFTGSREVGAGIYARAAQLSPGQRWLKRIQLEMGGKNAVVVDETADLDRAAREIVRGAFGFQGQKCSASSRAVLVDSVYEEVLSRVVEAARTLHLGDPVDPRVVVGPVIDDAAEEKVLDYIGIGRGEGQLLLGGSRPELGGYFVPPTIFGEVAPSARIAQEEIFGPVLAAIRARDYQHGIEIANGTAYGLTGSFFSRDPERIALAKDTFHVGNLYINRRSTGALMGVHPFGGFNMSGTDTKAGGPDYLLFYLQGQSIGEVL